MLGEIGHAGSKLLSQGQSSNDRRSEAAQHAAKLLENSVSPQSLIFLFGDLSNLMRRYIEYHVIPGRTLQSELKCQE